MRASSVPARRFAAFGMTWQRETDRKRKSARTAMGGKRTYPPRRIALAIRLTRSLNSAIADNSS